MLLNFKQSCECRLKVLSVYNVERISLEEALHYYLKHKNDVTTAQKILRAYNMHQESTLIL